MVEGTYDSDDDNRSPRLEPQRPNYQLDDEPPPFVSRRSSSNSDDAKKVDGKGTSLDRSRKHEPRKPETREGDSLLISYLDPTRSDLASFELRRSPHERLPLENDLSPGAGQKLIKPRKDLSDHTTTAGIASSALNLLGNEPLQHGLQDLKSLPPPPNKKGFNPDPPSSKHPGRLSISNHDPFGLPPFERTLPALQSPPESASAASPENLPKLPSIQSALSELSAVSPNDPAGRVKGTFPGGPGQFPTPQIPPSPYSHLSPASSKDMSNISSPVSQQSYWRPPLKSDIHYAASAHEPSPQAVKSPAAGYPTPTDQAGERPYNPGSQSNGTVPAGVYKCRHPGCDAPPFQTQYLLNSHATVHSDDRSHFCPVQGCPRAVGGKGFKRKNEMIRHGLVHNSPGYVCPFCLDQQHKYPRPDNLQRHVRVHHVDKDRDDPALRAVLAQRPEGSVRGRRRRMAP